MSAGRFLKSSKIDKRCTFIIFLNNLSSFYQITNIIKFKINLKKIIHIINT